MRRVTCIICDTEVLLDENTLLAKRLKNNPIRTFMCDECKSRLDTPRQRQHVMYSEPIHKENQRLDQ
ncbi:DUF2197 domain-containing protein [Staphylococcus sp. 17KM0847]|uniref:DUF2197 domain-containing protein n=1 Tax=Staphylococcus sp. 17KM0847 TaxID=2583989 RepID=UPI0015DCE2C0|nr:DUF2197 domain-containing protein [Staphylococcus sp. 17KM0847]QLK85744.1 DUF2197 domain-containing protein [Staphylococcus sp. 17KM0847]